VEKGFESGSRTELQVDWFGLAPFSPNVYVWEREDTDLESRRALAQVRLEACEGGHKMASGERERVLAAVEEFLKEEVWEQGQQLGANLSELCALCHANKGPDDEQVLCDRCDEGFHLECLDEHEVEYPDDIFEDEVELMWHNCLDKARQNEELEMVLARDAKSRGSRSGRIMQVPVRFR
jgi:hypothetical protein